VGLVDQAVRAVNQALSATCAEIHLEVFGWRREVVAGVAEHSVQRMIDSQLRFDKAEIVKCMFWSRLESPIEEALSGTVHELEIRLCGLEVEPGSPSTRFLQYRFASTSVI
jgi:hypothetical protein